MPGPLTTVARVRELGGLDDPQSYLEFRLASDPALVSRITTEIAVASAWLQSRGGADYASGDPVKDTLFAEAEAYLALQNLYETLKCRKVRGTQFPFSGEDSDRFQQLIDVEMPSHIQRFIDAYLAVEEQGKPWAAPAMALSRKIDRTQSPIESEREKLDDTIDEATGLPLAFAPILADGQHNL